MGSGSFSVGELPDWVVHDTYEADAGPDDRFIRGGTCHLLREDQIDLTGLRPAFHGRTAFLVLSQAGAERIANVSIVFDPSYQTPVVHYVRVIRGTNVFDHARQEAFDLLRREQNLERRILNGQLTASLIIPDVRTGDIVETCWTVHGQNPALGGKFFQWASLEMTSPVREMRFRLRTPQARNVADRAFGEIPAPVRNEADGIVSLSWSRRDCLAMEVENLTPSWQILARSVQFSEARDWGEVARLFVPHYAVEIVPDELRNEAARFATDFPDESTRAVEILRYTQKRIRYLSISLGEGGLVPRAIDQICASGYGDCKDAARLFVAVATLAGLDAAPALISTRYGPAICDWLPSGGIFDHCIVRVRIGGETYWLDPTMRSQAGALDEVYRPHFGWALPLTSATETLEEMGPPPQRLVADCVEKIAFGPRVSSPATFNSREVFGALYADSVRSQIANEGDGNILRNFRKRFENAWPDLADITKATIEENDRDNKVTVAGAYKIAGAWKKSGENRVAFAISDHTIARNLAALPAKERKHDIFLGVPRVLHRRVELEMPRNWSGTPTNVALQIPGLKYTKHLWIGPGKRVIQEQELTVSALTTPASSASGYSEIVKALMDRSILTVSSPISGDRFKASSRSRWQSPRMIIAGIWLLLVFLSMIARLANGH